LGKFRGGTQQWELSSAKVGVHLDHAGPGAFHGACDTGEFRFGGAQARRRAAIGGAMLGRARRAEAECAGPERFLEELAHVRYFVFGRAFAVIRAAIAHHIEAQRRVGNLDADIHDPGRFIQDIEVLTERFPTEVEPFREYDLGNVLDAVH